MRPMRIFVNDDRHVMAKHSSVYPTQEELEAVQNMVSHTERALKAVSDWIDEQEKGNSELSEAENMDTPPDDESKEGAGEQKAEHMTRTLRGVMRVGLVAKGLLLKGDLDLELVLLCKEKPTTALLDKVADNLAIQLTVSCHHHYHHHHHARGVGAGILVLVEKRWSEEGRAYLPCARDQGSLLALSMCSP